MSFIEFNKLLGYENITSRHNGFRKLIHVRIEPTEVCNFQCKFCITQDPERVEVIKKMGYEANGRKFDKDRLLDLLDELKEIGVEAISFVSVGEPLLFSGIEEVIDKAVRLNFVLSLTSNLSVPMKDSLIENLAKFNYIRWSMNGGSREVYLNTNNPKGKGRDLAFERSCENVKRIIYQKKLTNSKTLINSSFVISVWNFFDIENAAKLCHDLNVDNLFFRPDSLAMNGRTNQPLDILKENIDSVKRAKLFETDDFKIHADANREEDNMHVADDNLVCFYSNHSIYIAANGDVYPCCYTRMSKKYVIDNISNMDFRSFWKEQKYVDHYKDLNVNLCPGCPYNELNEKLKLVYHEGKDFSKEYRVDNPFV